MSFSVSFLHAQLSKNLSFGVLHSNLSGLNAELSYSNPLTNKVGITARYAYNLNKSYGIRGGLFYRIMTNKPLNLDFGVEYNYDRLRFNKLSEEVVSRNLEFPLTVSFSISNRYELYGGISSSINLNDSETNRLADNLRLGIRYKW